MAFQSQLWQVWFRHLPTWPCPTCAPGKLVLIKDTLKREETGASKRARSQDEWHPDWVEERFSALLKCSACGEVVSISGTMGPDLEQGYDNDGEIETTVVDLYGPIIMHPAPRIIDLPSKTPVAVARELDRASALIWVDAGSSANRLRAATEELLTALKVAAYVRKGKLSRLSLFARIEKFRKQNAEVAALLDSIRWVGNVGSHDSIDQIDRKDVLTTFEIMEHVLSELYDDKGKRLTRAAKDIAKRKGAKAIKRKK